MGVPVVMQMFSACEKRSLALQYGGLGSFMNDQLWPMAQQYQFQTSRIVNVCDNCGGNLLVKGAPSCMCILTCTDPFRTINVP